MNNLEIIFENNDFVVINKPTGLVVHKGAGDTGKTLVDIVLEKYPEMEKYSWPDPTRPGIVHRLDKDTSGLIVVAKNPESLKYFQEQFKSRNIKKTYVTLILGNIEPAIGEIKGSIHRHPQHRRQMTVSYLGKGKESITKYQTLQKYTYNNNVLSLLDVNLETGRMHQIRVHMKHKGYPVIGDQLYNTKLSNNISKLLNLRRQFLHAKKITLTIPNQKIMSFESNLPEELLEVLNNFQKI